MNMIRTASLPVLLASVIAACSGGSGGQSVLPRISVVDDSHVAVHARGAPDAIVSANGTLTIADRDVAVTAQQQEALKRYYAGVVAIHKDAIATGKAGLGTAGTALKSVVSGLSSGNPDRIGSEVEAQAAKVEAAAMNVCRDLSVIQTEQTAIAEQLAEFRPYAVIDARSVADCRTHRG